MQIQTWKYNIYTNYKFKIELRHIHKEFCNLETDF